MYETKYRTFFYGKIDQLGKNNAVHKHMQSHQRSFVL